MKKIILFTFLLTIMSSAMIKAQLPVETPEQKAERMKWWTDARFGMFIHWGLYALPARHEWVKRYERMTNEEYEKYFSLFDPDMYDPHEWAKMAKQAGMKYAVITTKHHEGFCMFDSEYTDYKVTNTPYGKDIIKQWVEAFREEGLGIGFYYSLLDWHHPDYTIDRNHPQSASSDEEYDKLNKGRNMDNYRNYIKNQVRELLTNYGKIDIIWLDYSFPSGKHGKGRDDWDSENLLKMVRELQPGIIVNDRLDLLDEDGGWDFTTPEQYKVSKWPEIVDGIKAVGILNMEIFRLENRLFMIVDTPDDFDWEKQMAKLATLPRQAEWEEFVSKFQKSSPDASSNEKWQMMDKIFDLSGKTDH